MNLKRRAAVTLVLQHEPDIHGYTGACRDCGRESSDHAEQVFGDQGTSQTEVTASITPA